MEDHMLQIGCVHSILQMLATCIVVKTGSTPELSPEHLEISV